MNFTANKVLITSLSFTGNASIIGLLEIYYFPTTCCEDCLTLFEQCVNYLECVYNFVKLQPSICFETTFILDYAFVHSNTRTYVLCIRIRINSVYVCKRERAIMFKMTFDLNSKYLCYFNLFKYFSPLWASILQLLFKI